MHSLQSPQWLLWNLWLSTIPVLLGYFLAWCAQVMRKNTPKLVQFAVLACLGLAWMAFLPNTCYLLTEWRHFFFDAPFLHLRAKTPGNREQLEAARYGFFFLAYSLYGILCFGMAIRPVHRMLRRMRAPLFVTAIPFFLLISLGVYLGLVVRLNSWQLITQTGRVLRIAEAALVSPVLLKVIVIFAVLLWLLYLIVDIWIDGVQMRLRSRPGMKTASAAKQGKNN